MSTQLALSPSATARLRWGGYKTGEPATDELRAAGLIRYAPEHVYRFGSDVQVLTPAGAAALSALTTRPAA